MAFERPGGNLGSLCQVAVRGGVVFKNRSFDGEDGWSMVAAAPGSELGNGAMTVRVASDNRALLRHAGVKSTPIRHEWLLLDWHQSCSVT
jgi:hypothetical protein